MIPGFWLKTSETSDHISRAEVYAWEMEAIGLALGKDRKVVVMITTTT